MTTTIVETVTAVGTTFSFAAVGARDVGVVGVRLVDDGTGLVSGEMPEWIQTASTGQENFFWKALTAGETTHTVTVDHTGGATHIVAILLRSDLPFGDIAGLADTDAAQFGFSFNSINADSAYVAFSMVRDGSIAMTGSWTMLATTGLAAGYAHIPFQVPAGTLIQGDGYFNTLRYGIGFEPWAGGAAPPASAAQWTGWIID